MKRISVLVILLINVFVVSAQQLAFPGAEGFGRFATGGRGGKIYEVTNLNDSGEGSLRAALAAFPGEPLTIVFKVGGTITLASELRIYRSNLTIAGQTAPGDGICLKGHSLIVNGARAISQGGNHGNIIIRYIRSRPGSTLSTGVYGFDMENCHDVIIDHCSFSWANEECAAMYDTKNVTVQWSIISEGLYNAGHAKGLRSYGGVWGGQYASYHHNLIANENSRAIRFNGARAHDTIALVDYRNNVIYNSGSSGAAYGGEVEINGGTSQVNIVNNYYKPGPAAASILFVQPSYTAASAKGVGQWFINGNIMSGSTSKTNDNWTGVDLSNIPAESQASSKSVSAFDVGGAAIGIQTAQAAYEAVLANAGVLLPVRDAVDTRIVSETATGTAYKQGATSGKYGIIDSPAEVGGWPNYASGTAAADSDHDGMPDSWELANSLNPNDETDRNTVNGQGFTMLEVYLNSISGSAQSTSFLGFGVVAKSGSELAADVKWTTSSETNLQKFTIERSSDNVNFSSLADVSATNQSSLAEYAYTDNSTLGGTSYYRIKITDNNSGFTYSSVVSYYRAVASAYWTEPFTSTSVTSINTPAAIANSSQSNGQWILYGAQKEERSVSSSDAANQWASGNANPSLKILNGNASTTTTYSLTEAPYLITPIFSQGISKITFNEILRSSIGVNSILVYTSTDGGATWSTTGISNQSKSSLFELMTININSLSVNRLKIAKPAGVTMNIDNLTIYGPVGVTLPLTFVSFDAVLTSGLNKYVSLQWKTTNEVNTSRFVVERSLNGKYFEAIAELGSKNTAGIHTYSVVDENPSIGYSYYRLKQVDANGDFKYYDKIITVLNNDASAFILYPNPANKVLKLNHVKAGSNALIQIKSIDGKILISLKPLQNSVSSQVDLTGLATGNYMLNYVDGAVKMAKQFIKN